ncbi:hypothetical protein [Pelagibius sp. Alg239-R121]|uniref:hypothetical protein n=1 Tax=Pelagibius sp. Alg239-R121 TaxID=2993448 RepID=UPI0024A64E95|nr:hypothetical protein [Pelagibius sp. Alg239-R121]
MNAPNISIPPSPLNPGHKPESGLTENGQGLDDVALLFPEMEVFHDLRISGDEDWHLLSAVTNRLGGQGARIVSLSLRKGDGSQTCIKCRLAGLTSKRVNELVGQLAQEERITSARVEHVILKS